MLANSSTNRRQAEARKGENHFDHYLPMILPHQIPLAARIIASIVLLELGLLAFRVSTP
jgi:hypothetical protein